MIRLTLIALFLIASTACGAKQQSQDTYHAPPVSAAATPRPQQGQQVVREAAADASGPSFFPRKDKKTTERVPSGGGGKDYGALDRKLVKNAWLRIQVKDEDLFEAAVEKGVEIARKLDGYVTNKTSKSIAFKVPSGRLDEALAALDQIGKVKDRNVTAVDVTANYVDLQIRIENLKKLRARLQELVKQGQNVEEILEVEKELGRVTTQLEALEGQMRLLQNQTSYATVTVNFEERVLPGPIGWVFYGAFHVVKWLFVWD